MSTHGKVKRLVLAFISAIFAMVIIGAPAFADTPSNLIPLEITPDCSNAASSTATWNVNNKNSTDVTINWTNQDDGQTGSYDAAPGMSTLATYFDSTDPNNTTQFVSESNTTQTNATQAACTPSAPTPPTNPTVPTQPSNPPATCVDGTIQQNLVTTYVSANTVSIHTVNNSPLCANVTLNLSSYTMPGNYDGRGFYLNYDPNNSSNDVANPTAYPQSLYDNQVVNLVAGSDGDTTATVNLPPSCQNSQVDLYYGSLQTVVGQNGTGVQNIISQLNQANGVCPMPPATGGKGAGSVPTPTTNTSAAFTTTASTAATPATGAAVSVNQVALPAQLAYTGQSPVAPYLIALSIFAATTGLACSVRRDARNL